MYNKYTFHTRIFMKSTSLFEERSLKNSYLANNDIQF
jgi:hypothetical protein